MEVGAHVWLRSDSSRWGWVPTRITKKEDGVVGGSSGSLSDAKQVPVIHLTLTNDVMFEDNTMDYDINHASSSSSNSRWGANTNSINSNSLHGEFETVITVDPEQLKAADHEGIKLRNLPRSYQLEGADSAVPTTPSMSSSSPKSDSKIIGGVDDLIGLTHLHEPAILHALRLRYDANIIYTSTGPILIAVNPFKAMPLYSESVMESYRLQGETSGARGPSGSSSEVPGTDTPFKRRTNDALLKKMNKTVRLPPHAYQTADDAYRAMMRGIENVVLMNGSQSQRKMNDNGNGNGNNSAEGMPTNQSILVSGESGAGKTATTKIVLNYLAMLSKVATAQTLTSPGSTKSISDESTAGHVSIEKRVLDSNPILESFGNARTIRNDNSSRFGKYIDIRFTKTGKLAGANIETYLLEKVRLIHPGSKERNYHVFYQFLSDVTRNERRDFFLDEYELNDFKMLSQTGEFGRRDGVSDRESHREMLNAMIEIGFKPETTQALMRLVVAVLFAGNMTFTAYDDDSCSLDESHPAVAVAALLGVSFEDLASALTYRTINTVHESIEKSLNYHQAEKAREALIKAIYGGAFDYIVKQVNNSIHASSEGGSAATSPNPNQRGAVSMNDGASIGVLDIFGFETFQHNNFEQLCINYTNEALQQQFNKYVFKLEQLEYEKEGILWKYISFPDNQDVLDLIDRRHVGMLAILDEQCIVPQSTDEKFTRYLYSKCDQHIRFSASSAQRVDYKFTIEHYAGGVEYSTDHWLEKNKDQLPAKSSALLRNSNFKLLNKIQKYVRSEERAGSDNARGSMSMNNGRRSIRGSVATKSVGAQFSEQLKTLRTRIDVTTPHYIRCLKPNDELIPDHFEPKNIVEQLRCGGVLEAVRVSRAGYPTRYPHDVFLARYYILGGSDGNGNGMDSKPVSPVHNIMNWLGSKEEKLKTLIHTIILEIWEADQQMIEHIEEAEKAHIEMDSPRRTKVTNSPVFARGSTYVNGPPSLAVQSSVRTPPEKRRALALQKKNKLSRLSLQSVKHRAEHHSSNLIRPETREEFLNLDFVSKCAVAGLQLGRSKVFLRREAFDRIEALRSQKFFGSAVTIQAMVRGKLYREQFVKARSATIVLQSFARILLARRNVVRRRFEIRRQSAAASVIQRAFRSAIYRRQTHSVSNIAATMIQARFRGISSRNNYYATLFGIYRIQALWRGRDARAQFTQMRFAATSAAAAAAAVPMVVPSPSPVKIAPPVQVQRPHAIVPAPVAVQPVVVPQNFSPAMIPEGASAKDLYHYVQQEDWANVERALDQNPVLAETVEPSSGELPLHVIARHAGAWTLLVDMVLVLNPKALIHRDNMGALPIHHAAAHDNLSALEIIFSAYKEGINEVDVKGRLPLHVAAEFDAVDAVKFLLSNSSEGAFTMVYRPMDGSGGGLPLHVACRNYASIGVITALLAENFASAKRTDENGDLPIHLLLKCGERVDQVVVKTLLTCFSSASARTDMNGDLPLSLAIKNRCKPSVINTILMQYPNAASTLNSFGQSPLHLAFEHGCDDRTILGLLNHAPEFATLVDKKSGLLPIQVATQHEHSHFIVHNLVKRDMPIECEEKVRAQLLPHHYSWNHLVSATHDLYHQVVTKILQQCTQPQVLALAHVEGPDGKIALASATTVCKHELRVMLRLFNTLEVVNQRPAYTNPISDTQIFYALRYDPPATQSNAFTILHEEKKDQALGDYVEDFDDASVTSALSRHSMRSTLSSRSQQSVDEKLRQIRKEKGQQVIAKLTSRSDVVERELKVRKDYHLSRHYVPAIISVHHTVQHAAYSEAMAEPGYCITMEGADTTAENLMLDMRRAGKPFPRKALKRIGISLLHMHEHNLVHCDFGTHNIGKFGSRWKLLGVGGSVPVGKPTNPNRGFYHPPESIVVEHKKAAIGKKAVTAVVVSIPGRPSYDVWAYGVVLYEAIAGIPLSAYACRGKRAMSSAEVAKIGQWDEHCMKKALRHLPPEIDDQARSLIKNLLHYDPSLRYNSMRQVLEHPFFAGSSSSSSVASSSIVSSVRPMQQQQHQQVNKDINIVPQATASNSISSASSPDSSPPKRSGGRFSSSRNSSFVRNKLDYVDKNVPRDRRERPVEDSDGESVSSKASKSSRRFGFRKRFGKKDKAKRSTKA